MKDKQVTVQTNNHGEYLFWCPGCGEVHCLKTLHFGQPANHHFNNDFEKPTFCLESGAPFTCVDNPPDSWCHFTITDGIINYLYCSHHLSNIAVEMREYNEWGGIKLQINDDGDIEATYEF